MKRWMVCLALAAASCGVVPQDQAAWDTLEGSDFLYQGPEVFGGLGLRLREVDGKPMAQAYVFGSGRPVVGVWDLDVRATEQDVIVEDLGRFRVSPAGLVPHGEGLPVFGRDASGEMDTILAHQCASAAAAGSSPPRSDCSMPGSGSLAELIRRLRRVQAVPDACTGEVVLVMTDRHVEPHHMVGALSDRVRVHGVRRLAADLDAPELSAVAGQAAERGGTKVDPHGIYAVQVDCGWPAAEAADFLASHSGARLAYVASRGSIPEPATCSGLFDCPFGSGCDGWRCTPAPCGPASSDGSVVQRTCPDGRACSFEDGAARDHGVGMCAPD